MKYIFLLLFSLGCASTQDIEKERKILKGKVADHAPYNSSFNAFQKTKEHCKIFNKIGRLEIKLDEKSKIIRQSKDKYGYFETVCFTKRSYIKRLEIIARNRGLYGEKFLVIPRISFFNDKGTRLSNLYIQNKGKEGLSGSYRFSVDISTWKNEKYYMIVEAENRFEKSSPSFNQQLKNKDSLLFSLPVGIYSSPIGSINFILK